MQDTVFTINKNFKTTFWIYFKLLIYVLLSGEHALWKYLSHMYNVGAFHHKNNKEYTKCKYEKMNKKTFVHDGLTKPVKNFKVFV